MRDHLSESHSRLLLYPWVRSPRIGGPRVTWTEIPDRYADLIAVHLPDCLSRNSCVIRPSSLSRYIVSSRALEFGRAGPAVLNGWLGEHPAGSVSEPFVKTFQGTGRLALNVESGAARDSESCTLPKPTRFGRLQ